MKSPNALRPRVPSLPPDDERALGLLAEEIFDLAAAIDELDRRREKLRAAVLQLCRASNVRRWEHARGTISISRYASYKIDRASSVLALVQGKGWEDDVLSVKGRALHKLAQGRPEVLAALAPYPKVERETLTMMPSRRR